MFTSTAFLFLILLLTIAFLAQPLSERLHVPFSLVLVFTGYAGSEIFVRVLGQDTGITWHNFRDIIFYLFIPIIIFYAAISLDVKLLCKNSLIIFMLALPLLLVSTLMTAIFIYYGIDHPAGFPWIAALLLSAILSATDPSSVMPALKGSNSNNRVSILLEGESLFSDAAAVMLFSLTLTIAVSGENSVDLHVASYAFIKLFIGGIAAGVIMGFIASLLVKFFKRAYIVIFISISGTYCTFIIVEDLLHLSGVMAVLVFGIYMGQTGKKIVDRKIVELTIWFWSFISRLTSMIIFILAGLTITWTMFQEQWLAMLIAIAAVIISRATIVFGPLSLFSKLPNMDNLSIREQGLLTWGGTRGMVALALALSLPLSLDYWYTLQSMAYGVVVFSLLVQATTMIPITR